MSDIAIKVENLSKLYQLGSIGTGTLGNDLKRWWAQTRGKEDPFAKIGQINDRTKKNKSEFVWALKDIDFEVKQGEVLGIIGRNGAGKSTLLKILSKITSPTTGKIKTNGRIASLLEVGTGFHPDLSGRDNIFMNGAILGMRKWEVEKKFDEIVDFSGVEAYIDTPVKRYSSGMYVRLAFAVAAFLEPEILIVDEVLAVGDSEFQKKCLGRMKDVSVNDGRTVLFVSHNISAVRNLCGSGLLLTKGFVKQFDNIDTVLNTYLHGDSAYVSENKIKYFQLKHTSESIKIDSVEVLSEPKKYGDNLIINTKWNISKELSFSIECVVRDHMGSPLSFFSTGIFNNYEYAGTIGLQEIRIVLPKLQLAEGVYFLDIMAAKTSKSFFVYAENVLKFSIEESDPGLSGKHFRQGNGSLYLDHILETSMQKIQC